jgi:hypothetical protein
VNTSAARAKDLDWCESEFRLIHSYDVYMRWLKFMHLPKKHTDLPASCMFGIWMTIRHLTLWFWELSVSWKNEIMFHFGICGNRVKAMFLNHCTRLC